MIVPVLLAGGIGTRLWPLSREARPKQFLPLAGDDSLLVQALHRVATIEGVAPPLVVGREEHRFMIAEELRRAGVDGRILLEPEGRNTAPAAAVAALEALDKYGEDIQVLVLPSDHVIGDRAAFAAAIAAARNTAASGRPVTFGVAPTRPETGYGYIRAGAALVNGAYAIDAFVEKPDHTRATAYLEEDGYYWNSGVFLFSADNYLQELERLAPDILAAATTAHTQGTRDADFLRLDADAFRACPSDSIDYAVMEKTDGAAMVPLESSWNDLGSWSAVAQVREADTHGNRCHGDVLTEGTENCFIHSDGRLVAMLGMRDTIVVETVDAVLVADQSREQEIKSVVSRLHADGRSEASEHHTVYRPWGSYESIASGSRFQVKRIVVRPGGRLSLQKHHHRAEHWVVVEGTARVTRDQEQMLLSENQSTFLPLGSVHRLENPGKCDLVVIEVQSGGYLGEDDIVRFEDVYGRTDAETDKETH